VLIAAASALLNANALPSSSGGIQTFGAKKLPKNCENSNF
jgi:hypothetical protein